MTDSKFLVWPRNFRALALLSTAGLLTLNLACGNPPSEQQRQETAPSVSAAVGADEFCTAWAQIHSQQQGHAASQVTATPHASVDLAPKRLTDEAGTCPPCAETPKAEKATPPAPQRHSSATPSSKMNSSSSELQRIF